MAAKTDLAYSKLRSKGMHEGLMSPSDDYLGTESRPTGDCSSFVAEPGNMSIDTSIC